MLKKNGTWELTALPVGNHACGCKWANSLEYLAGASIDLYNSILVRKGLRHCYDVDYREILAPVSKLNLMRMVIDH